MIDEQMFDNKLAKVKEHFRKLMDCPLKVSDDIVTYRMIRPKEGGVYLFSEQTESTERFMYVGQSNDILERLRDHCGISKWDRANFAYKLTVESTGLAPIPYSPTNTKTRLFDDPRFKEGFKATLARICAMNYRWVAVEDKLERNLLEIYTAVILGSRFNSFD